MMSFASNPLYINGLRCPPNKFNFYFTCDTISRMPKSIAIIAGAGPGTGSAIARRFAKAYPVVVLARSQSSLDPLVSDITQSGGSAMSVPTDVSNSSSMTSTMAKSRPSLVLI